MHPEIIHIGRFAVRSWGLMAALAFLVGLFIASLRAPKFNINKNVVPDILLVILVSSLLGSRFFYVIFHLDEFRGNWMSTINPFAGDGAFGIAGLSMMGGIVFAIIATWAYTKIKKVPFLDLGDTIAPGFLIGAGITRIGCFLNGCCFGRPTDSILGTLFPPHCPAGDIYPHTHIHPTQIYASLLGFAFFGLVLILERFHSFRGFTMWMVLLLYSIDRFIVDMFRHYEAKQVLFNIGHAMFSVNELVVVGLFVLSAVMLIKGYKKKNAN
ncbi:MAG: prolipoprotein diacylglyceryl transferase [Candidatus Zixiibacteriota bacterium]